MKNLNAKKILRTSLAAVFMMGVSFFAKAQSICPGSAITFNAQSGMLSYSWSNGLGTGASVTVTPTATTTYTCTETDLFGGTVTETFTATVLASNDPSCVNGGGGSGGGPTGGGSTGVTTCAGTGVTFNAQSGMLSYSWDNGLGTSASVTVFPTTSTSYTCTEIDFSGNTTTETFDVTVLASTDPQCTNGGGGTDTTGGGTGGGGTTTTPTDTIKACAGDIITLTADADQLLYIWDNNLDGSQIQRVSPTVSTTYTVTMLPLSGGATTSHIYYVEVLASTDPLCSTGTGAPCTTKSGKAGTVDCGSGSGKSGSSGKSGNGTACTCKATTAKPSTGTSSGKPSTVKPSSGKPGKGKSKSGKKRISTGDINMSLNVTENPFKGDLSLTINSASTASATVAIYDVTGRLVAEDKNVQSNTVFTAKHDLNNGIYFVHVSQAGITTMTKVVKSGN